MEIIIRNPKTFNEVYSNQISLFQFPYEIFPNCTAVTCAGQYLRFLVIGVAVSYGIRINFTIFTSAINGDFISLNGGLSRTFINIGFSIHLIGYDDQYLGV